MRSQGYPVRFNTAQFAVVSTSRLKLASLDSAEIVVVVLRVQLGILVIHIY